VLYRLFRPEDFTQLYAIEQACFEPPVRFGRRYMRALIDGINSATWIAEDNGQMAGFAIADWTQEANLTVAYIQTVEVSPGKRNQGIASELLNRIETSARAAHAQFIWLHVAEQNSAAIRLYEARGFLSQGREENYYGSSHHALIYAKPLERIPAV